MGVPSDDRYHVAVRAAAVTYLTDGLEAGRLELRSIAADLWSGLPPVDLPPARDGTGQTGRSFDPGRSASVFRRDGFQCRYCERSVIPRPIAELVAHAYPQEVPFNTHYKAGHIHALFWTRVAEADHIRPGSRGGEWDDPFNHATACVACNVRKANYTLDELGWTLGGPEPEPAWDGMVPLYQPLWLALGQPAARRHRVWMRALGAHGFAGGVMGDPGDSG